MILRTCPLLYFVISHLILLLFSIFCFVSWSAPQPSSPYTILWESSLPNFLFPWKITGAQPGRETRPTRWILIERTWQKALWGSTLANNCRRSFSIRHEKMTVCVGKPAVYVVKHGKRIEKFDCILSVSNGKQVISICSKIIFKFVYFIRR